MSDNIIRVVVADDQASIREALAVMLDLLPDISVVGSAENGASAVEVVLDTKPDVLLTDLRMPVLDGAQATAQVLEALPETAIVLLTTYDDETSILQALQAGARGYLTKDAGRDEIAGAIRAAAAGQSVLDSAVQRRLVQAALGAPSAPQSAAPHSPALKSAESESPPVDLTNREVQVLSLIAQGLSNRDLARTLFVSESTVKTHINNLFAKAHLSSRADAVRYAYAHGYATPET